MGDIYNTALAQLDEDLSKRRRAAVLKRQKAPLSSEAFAEHCRVISIVERLLQTVWHAQQPASLPVERLPLPRELPEGMPFDPDAS